jgi:hypothetical protein
LIKPGEGLRGGVGLFGMREGRKFVQVIGTPRGSGRKVDEPIPDVTVPGLLIVVPLL